MWLVAIETSGKIGSVAVARDGELMLEYEFPAGPRHGRDIVPAIDDLLKRLGLKKKDIELVGVSIGPGSFTGLRVGASCAKTLSWALGWSIVSVPSLDVIVQNAGARSGYASPVIDARRKFVYTRVYTWKDDLWCAESEIFAGEPQDAASLIPEGALVFGDGVRAYPDTFQCGIFTIGDERLCRGKARHVARLAYERYIEGRRDDPLRLVPQYYRITEAEEKIVQREKR